VVLLRWAIGFVRCDGVFRVLGRSAHVVSGYAAGGHQVALPGGLICAVIVVRAEYEFV